MWSFFIRQWQHQVCFCSFFPGTRVHPVSCPAMSLTLGRYGSLSFLYSLYYGIFLSFDAGLLSFDPTQFFELGDAGLRDSVLRLSILLLHGCRLAHGLRGGFDSTFTARWGTRRLPRSLVVLTQDALRRCFSLMGVLAFSHVYSIEISSFVTDLMEKNFFTLPAMENLDEVVCYNY